MSTEAFYLTPLERLLAESDIRKLIAQYVHNVDDGKIAANAELLADARFQVADTVVTGRDAVARFFNSSVQHHADGTPRTWHDVSNTILAFESATTASAVSYFTVHQELPGLALQPIVTGRYADTFVRRDDAWRFASRRVEPRLFGNLSHHVAAPDGNAAGEQS